MTGRGQHNVEALLLMGEYQQKFGDDEQARINFEQAVAADQTNFDAAFALADYWYVKAGKNNKSAAAPAHVSPPAAAAARPI